MTTSIPTLCGSVSGRPSRLGLSMHNPAYEELGLDYRYVALGSDNLAETIAEIKVRRFRGLGVSIPFKQSVLQYLDTIHPDVRVIGACNTVVNDRGG